MELHRSIIRLAVEDAYGSWKWKVKVDNMADIEVAAMYGKLVKNRTIKPANPDNYCICGDCNAYYRDGLSHICEC